MEDKKLQRQGLLRQFAGYAGLNILGMIGLSCYILADTFFIAQGLAADGLAALNLAIPIYSLIAGCGKMLGMGGAIQYSVLRGQGEDRRAKAAFSWSIAVCLALSLVFFLAGLFCSGPIARLLGARGGCAGDEPPLSPGAAAVCPRLHAEWSAGVLCAQ